MSNENFIKGILNLTKPSYLNNEYFIGKVVDVSDTLGRIKVMIDCIFEGLSTNDLPWINMEPSTGLMVRPQIGDSVKIRFINSIYEGYYTSNFLNASDVDKLASNDLSSYFIFNLNETIIHGKYDGKYLQIKSKNFEITDNDGSVTIKTNQDINVQSTGNKIDIEASTDVNVKSLTGKVVVESATGIELGGDLATVPCNDLPNCLILNGSPHSIVSAIPGPTSVKVP